MKRDTTIGWRLSDDQRGTLLERFPPKFAKAVADHVTLASRVEADRPLPLESHGEIVGRADDGRGVEAMVVAIGGTTRRPDGGVYHITWSLADGRQARESNYLLAGERWQTIDPPIQVRLQPARFG